MVVVISSPLPIEQESRLINELFDNGLEYFHLRKPDYVEQEIIDLLNEINSAYHQKISLHQYHHLAAEYDIKRLHFNEFKRKNKEHCNYGNEWIKSTSLHDDSEAGKEINEFDYCFYGPVYDSISKEGYAKMPSIKIDQLRGKYINKIVAIGGVNSSNLDILKKEGYDGIALLGSVWQQPEKAILNYNDIVKRWTSSGQ